MFFAISRSQRSPFASGVPCRSILLAKSSVSPHIHGNGCELAQLRPVNNAAECIRLAEAARTSEHKSFFIDVAERWLTLAERAEKTQAR